MDQISVRHEPAATVVEVRGRFDIATIDAIRPMLEAAAEAAESRLVLRLGGVSFLDSTGLGALVALQKDLAYHGKLLLLTEVPPQAHMVLLITHLEWMLTCYGTLEEALAA